MHVDFTGLRVSSAFEGFELAFREALSDELSCATGATRTHAVARSRTPRKTPGVYISDEDMPRVIRALEHYAAYMRATLRDDRDYAALAAALQPEPLRCCDPSLSSVRSKPN